MLTIYHNLLTIKDESKANEVFEAMGTEESAFDFNVVVPKPERFESEDEESEWAYENWGTKRNALEAKRIGACHMYFQTAWGGVDGMIEKVVEKFGVGEFTYTFSSEFRDDRCGGMQRGKNGKIELIDPPTSRRAVRKFNKHFYRFLEKRLGTIEIPDLNPKTNWIDNGNGMIMRFTTPDEIHSTMQELQELVRSGQVAFEPSGN